MPNIPLAVSLGLNPVTNKYESGYVSTYALSGSNGALSWEATAKADGAYLRVSAPGLTAPDSLNFLGFGRGWLYSQTDGTKLAQSISVRTALGNESFVYEYGLGAEMREVYSEGSQKFLKSVLFPGGDSSQAKVGAGMVNWDSGAEIVPGKVVRMYRRERCTMRVEDAGKLFQIKGPRIRAAINSAGNHWNSCYVKQDYSTGAVASDCYEGTGARVYFAGDNALQADGQMTGFSWSWKVNTPDLLDGSQSFVCSKGGDYVVDIPYISSAPNNPTSIVKSTATERPRWLMWQDYIGNNGASAQDIEIVATDWYVQVGGSYLIITDNVNPALRTKHCPLVLEYQDGSGKLVYRLWKGDMTDYSTAAIALIADDGSDIYAAAL